MEEKEKRGSVFAQFTKDYMAFSRFERKREFSFMDAVNRKNLQMNC